MSRATPPPSSPGDDSNLPPPVPYGQAPIPGIARDGRPYAPWQARAVSLFVDVLPVTIVLGIAFSFFFSSTQVVIHEIGGQSYTTVETTGPGIPFFSLVLLSIVYWYYNKGYLEGTTGKSFAKRFTGYTTVGESTGKPLGPAMGCLRALLVYAEFVSVVFCIGLVLWLWPLWDHKRQALLSDKATGAVVFKD